MSISSNHQGNWVPACGGTEVPFMSRSGIRMQYLFQPSTGIHAYINCGTDIIMSDEEASQALQVQTSAQRMERWAA